MESMFHPQFALCSTLDNHPVDLINQQSNQSRPASRFELQHHSPFPLIKDEPMDNKAFNAMKMACLNESMKMSKKPAKTSKPRPCLICGRILSSASSYYVHMKQHSTHKPYQCPICDVRFCRKPYLETHIRTHTGERPFACEFCQKRFTQKSTLNIHRRTHTGERPYACDFCDKTFAVKSYADAHRWTHGVDQPTKCSKCLLRFNTKSQYSLHMRNVHSNGHLHECQCGRVFLKESHLVRHQIRVHKQPTNNISDLHSELFSQFGFHPLYSPFSLNKDGKEERPPANGNEATLSERLLNMMDSRDPNAPFDGKNSNASKDSLSPNEGSHSNDETASSSGSSPASVTHCPTPINEMECARASVNELASDNNCRETPLQLLSGEAAQRFDQKTLNDNNQPCHPNNSYQHHQSKIKSRTSDMLSSPVSNNVQHRMTPHALPSPSHHQNHSSPATSDSQCDEMERPMDPSPVSHNHYERVKQFRMEHSPVLNSGGNSFDRSKNVNRLSNNLSPAMSNGQYDRINKGDNSLLEQNASLDMRGYNTFRFDPRYSCPQLFSGGAYSYQASRRMNDPKLMSNQMPSSAHQQMQMVDHYNSQRFVHHPLMMFRDSQSSLSPGNAHSPLHHHG